MRKFVPEFRSPNTFTALNRAGLPVRYGFSKPKGYGPDNFLGFMRLVLHIGRPKTGTTALQAFLREKRELIGRFGLLVPRIQDLGPSDIREICAGDPESDGMRTLVRDVQANSDFSTCVISSEHLGMGMLPRPQLNQLTTNLQKIFSSVEICIYLRPQHTAVLSAWGQSGRANGQLNLNQFACRWLANPISDYAALVQLWGTNFGLHALNVRIAEPQDRRFNVVEDFLGEVLGLNGEALTSAAGPTRNREKVSPPWLLTYTRTWSNRLGAPTLFKGTKWEKILQMLPGPTLPSALSQIAARRFDVFLEYAQRAGINLTDLRLHDDK